MEAIKTEIKNKTRRALIPNPETNKRVFFNLVCYYEFDLIKENFLW